MKNPFQKKCLDTALDIGMQLCKDAIWFENQCNWITASMESENTNPKIYFKSLESDFYGGTTGVAFFLNSLSKYTDEPLIKITAKGAISHAIASKDKVLETVRLGYFTGWTGLVFTILQFEENEKKDYYTSYIQSLLNEIVKIDYQKSGIDIIDGIASAILSLIGFCQNGKNQFLKPYITELGDYLISIAQQEHKGLSWNTMKGVKFNLTGYAHGSSGFIHAFIELYNFTKEKKYLDIVYQAQLYENSHFIKEQYNWPDFRNFEAVASKASLSTSSTYNCSCAWCHGAPGIGLSRLRCFEITKDKIFLKDANIAIKTTKEQISLNSENGLSLCHGLLGNAELLIYGSKLLNDRTLKDTVVQLSLYVINELYDKNKPLINGLGNDYLIPDFMTGLSGMGYHFLRMYDEKNTISPLLLCPSITN
jgi:lantibiotic biosynthesis protein